MASALDAVLAIRQSRIDQQNLQNQQVQHAMDMLQQSRQFQAQQQLAQLNTKVGAAQSGIAIGQDGSLSYNPSLLNPLSQFTTALKAQADAKTAMNPGAFNAMGSFLNKFTGGNSGQMNPNGQMTFQTSQGPISAGQQPSSTSLDSFIPPTTPASSSTQMTPMSATTDPVSGLPTVQSKNVQGEAKSAAITQEATDIAKAKSDANVSSASDAADLAMITGESRNLMNYYDKADKEGLAGSKLNEFLADQALNPLTKTTGKLAAPQGAEGAAGFQSAQNAFITRLEPIFQKQFGVKPSSRILQSLIEMGGKEVGNLGNPRDVVAGKISSTMDSAYRMMKAGQYYKNAVNGLSGDDLAQKVLDNWQSTKLSPQEENKLQSMKDYATSKNAPTYQSGITKKVGNTTYVRQDNGTWAPQS